MLKSGVSGLFGGNPLLGRERADTLQLSASRKTGTSRLSATLFHRRDDDLIDWTFSSASPFARQANAVDIDVSGMEILWQRDFESVSVATGLGWIDKDADYGTASVDASFYALNYATQRLALSLAWRPRETLELRLDTEARKQEDNVLRAGSDDAFIASAAVVWLPPSLDGLRIDLVGDNLTNSNFQEFPGTPSTRRQVSVRAAYRW